MAYDGLVVAACVEEFRQNLIGGKITKIAQPEKDEIHLKIYSKMGRKTLKISVNPSLPMCTLIEESKTSPLLAPAFSMVLRKQIGNGIILSIRQPDQSLKENGLERVIIFEIEHLDEMGDSGRRFLSIELMGRYSNIILLREDYTIIDAIKRIPASQSSLREVLPNRPYFIPDQQKKRNALSISEQEFTDIIKNSKETIYLTLFHSLSGISPAISSELCNRCGIDSDKSACMSETIPDAMPESMSDSVVEKAIDNRTLMPGGIRSINEKISLLYNTLKDMLNDSVIKGRFYPNILLNKGVPEDFSAIEMHTYSGSKEYSSRHYDSMSEVIRLFYLEKDKSDRMRQKSADLRKLVSTLLERSSRKMSLQEKQLRDTEGLDRFRLYGELLTAYGYGLKGGEESIICENYNTGKEISIPLRKDLSALDNAKRYFAKYDKQKRTQQAVSKQLAETRLELTHLQSIFSALDFAENEGDLREIRKELSDFGFLKNTKTAKKEKIRAQDKSRPHHFISTDGYEIYIGKNNYQNELLSFQLSEGGDLWFHAKNIPGSHVIVKTRGQKLEALPDRLFIEAAGLAAWFSSHRQDNRVEVDYTLRKNLKKVPNAAPGFVIYHTNYSVTVKPALIHP